MKSLAHITRRAAVSLLMACGFATAGAQAAELPGQGRKVVLLVQRDGPNLPVDEKVKAHLESRGFAVTLQDQSAAPSVAAGADLVVISSTVAAKDVSGAWRQLPVPLLTWENDLLDDLAMTGKRHDTDFGEAAKELGQAGAGRHHHRHLVRPAREGGDLRLREGRHHGLRVARAGAPGDVLPRQRDLHQPFARGPDAVRRGHRLDRRHPLKTKNR